MINNLKIATILSIIIHCYFFNTLKPSINVILLLLSEEEMCHYY